MKKLVWPYLLIGSGILLVVFADSLARKVAPWDAQGGSFWIQSAVDVKQWESRLKYLGGFAFVLGLVERVLGALELNVGSKQRL